MWIITAKGAFVVREPSEIVLASCYTTLDIRTQVGHGIIKAPDVSDWWLAIFHAVQ